VNSAGRGVLESELSDPPARGRHPFGETVHRFVRRYGWRAYALLPLVVITVIALMSSGRSTGSSGTRAEGPAGATPAAGGTGSTSALPTAASSKSIKSDDPGPQALGPAPAADALPAGGPYTVRGTGAYSVIPGTGPVTGTGTLRRYSVEAENGITGINLTAFANMVQQVLSDPKSWTAGHGLALERVDTGKVDFHVTLTSSMTVRSLCGYDIPVETSCFAASGTVPGLDVNRVVVNDSRWVRGDAAYVGDLNAYRIYMINHEDGHALGHRHAHACLADGLAPVMMQQTIGLKSTTGQLCQANPWPYPTGAADAPGIEAADTTINNEFNLQNQ
jgi:Protein of unknown function (DUF3152)